MARNCGFLRGHSAPPPHHWNPRTEIGNRANFYPNPESFHRNQPGAPPGNSIGPPRPPGRLAAAFGDALLALVSLTIWDGNEIRRVYDIGNVDTSSDAYEYGMWTAVFVTAGAARAVGARPTVGAGNIPRNALDTFNYIRRTGAAPPGYQGGRVFANDGRGGGQVLPRTDARGNPVTYRYYDVNPYTPGVNRGDERLVVGSDGRGYYTSSHYGTFTPIGG